MAILHSRSREMQYVGLQYAPSTSVVGAYDRWTMIVTSSGSLSSELFRVEWLWSSAKTLPARFDGAVTGGEAQETVSDRGVEDISSGDVETIEESSDVTVTAMEDLRDGGVLKERAESAVARSSKRRLTAREDVENVDERRFFADAVSLDL